MGDEACGLTVMQTEREAEAGEDPAWGRPPCRAARPPPGGPGPPAQPSFSPCISSRLGFFGPQTPARRHPSQAPSGDGWWGAHANAAAPGLRDGTALGVRPPHSLKTPRAPLAAAAAGC